VWALRSARNRPLVPGLRNPVARLLLSPHALGAGGRAGAVDALVQLCRGLGGEAVVSLCRAGSYPPPRGVRLVRVDDGHCFSLAELGYGSRGPASKQIDRGGSSQQEGRGQEDGVAAAEGDGQEGDPGDEEGDAAGGGGGGEGGAAAAPQEAQDGGEGLRQAVLRIRFRRRLKAWLARAREMLHLVGGWSRGVYGGGRGYHGSTLVAAYWYACFRGLAQHRHLIVAREAHGLSKATGSSSCN
jgi:hypothetical protein